MAGVPSFLDEVLRLDHQLQVIFRLQVTLDKLHELIARQPHLPGHRGAEVIVDFVGVVADLCMDARLLAVVILEVISMIALVVFAKTFGVERNGHVSRLVDQRALFLGDRAD